MLQLVRPNLVGADAYCCLYLELPLICPQEGHREQLRQGTPRDILQDTCGERQIRESRIFLGIALIFTAKNSCVVTTKYRRKVALTVYDTDRIGLPRNT